MRSDDEQGCSDVHGSDSWLLLLLDLQKYFLWSAAANGSDSSVCEFRIHLLQSDGGTMRNFQVVEKDNIIKKLKIHFSKNPQKLYSVVYFSNKWKRNYWSIRNYLEFLVRCGYVLKFYFSANQGMFAWGVPKPIFAVYVLNPNLSKGQTANKLTLCKPISLL